MLSLNDSEEILAIVVAVAIVLVFAYSTYMEIQKTISEEKEKQAEKKKIEEKIKTLTAYLNAKSNLINTINETKKRLIKRKNK